MPVKLNNFAAAPTIASSDYLVGYTNTNAGGERRWTLQQIANAIATIQPFARYNPRALATAWVSFKGTGMAVNGNATIYDKHNVANVIRRADFSAYNTRGYVFEIIFQTPMINKNYAVVGMGTIGSGDSGNHDDQIVGIKNFNTNTINSFQIGVCDAEVRNAVESSDWISLVIFGGI